MCNPLAYLDYTKQIGFDPLCGKDEGPMATWLVPRMLSLVGKLGGNLSKEMVRWSESTHARARSHRLLDFLLTDREHT